MYFVFSSGMVNKYDDHDDHDDDVSVPVPARRTGTVPNVSAQFRCLLPPQFDLLVTVAGDVDSVDFHQPVADPRSALGRRRRRPPFHRLNVLATPAPHADQLEPVAAEVGRATQLTQPRRRSSADHFVAGTSTIGRRHLSSCSQSRKKRQNQLENLGWRGFYAVGKYDVIISLQSYLLSYLLLLVFHHPLTLPL